MIKKNSSKLIFSNQWLDFYNDEIRQFDGSIGNYSWVRRNDGVGIIVLSADKKILLNHEFRYVINQYSWEVPGGGIDEGETALAAAVREVKEETGLTIMADQCKQIGAFYPLNSFNTEKISLFLAQTSTTQLTKKGLEVGETIAEQKFFTVSEALEMIDQGIITDMQTVNAIQLVVRKYL